MKNTDNIGLLLNPYSSGGDIHIKPSHRGRLTELKARTGKTEAELYNDGNPAHKKMVVFARNARKWKHADGGHLNSFPNGGKFITTLSPDREDSFMKDWQAFASLYNLARNPDDPEHYYDYRGFWDANKKSSAVNPFTWETKSTDGHLPDTWKTPGHPTFSVESVYAKYAPGLAGTWENGIYIPPVKVDQDTIKFLQRYAESAFDDKAKSNAGAMGAYQLMPDTAAEHAKKLGRTGDIFDPVYNEALRDSAFAQFYNSEVATAGNPTDLNRTLRALAMYNYGWGNTRDMLKALAEQGYDINGSTDWVDAIPVKETRNYLKFIGLQQDVPGTSYTRSALEKAAKAHGYTIPTQIDGQKVARTYGMLSKAYGGDITRMVAAIKKGR